MNATGNLRREFEAFKAEVEKRLSALEEGTKTVKTEKVEAKPVETAKSSKSKKKYDTVVVEAKDDDIVATEA